MFNEPGPPASHSTLNIQHSTFNICFSLHATHTPYTTQMNLSRQIACRYLRRPTDRLVSAVGLVSVLGLVIGVMALVISMALMTGYRRDLQRKLLGGNAEVFVYSVTGPMSDTGSVVNTVRTTPGVAEASPVIFLHALVTTERNSTGSEVMVKGFEPARARSTPMLAKIVG